MHHATLMLENNSYVRCLLIDFSKAFDIVRHTIILSKLSALDLPSSVLNWIIAFLLIVLKCVKLLMVGFLQCILLQVYKGQVSVPLYGLLWQVTSVAFLT